MTEDGTGEGALPTPGTTTDREVLATARDWLEEGTDGVLATLVAVEGRAYRLPGARLAYAPDRGRVGALTAGCAEARLADLAETVDDPRVETFDLSGDGDAWGLGAGCNGTIQVLLEPLADHLRPAFDALEDDAGVGTVVASTDDRFAVGDRIRPDDCGSVAGALGSANDEHGTLSVETDRGTVHAFRDPVARPPRLVVVGSGPDVHPVVDLAARTRFDVTVVGFRGRRTDGDRFPAADRVVATSPRSFGCEVDLDDETYVVVMSHNFVDDRLAVEAALDSSAPYVGVMGPRERLEAMREEGDIPESDALYAPVGLDVGGDTPYEVANSIVSEVLAVHSGRQGGHLDETERVHDRAKAGQP